MKLPKELQTADPDIRGSWAAMHRAAKRARELSIATGTPFYVMRNGKVVDLNAATTTQRKVRTSRRSKKSRAKH